MSLLGSFFNLSGWQPFGDCLTWNRGLIWLHAGSDALILLSCLSIPVSLVWLLRWRRDRTYRWIAGLFTTFFAAVSIIHALAILTLWVPAYGWDALAKVITAAASVATATILWIIAPRLAAMLSPAQMTNLNTELTSTVDKQETTLHALLGIEQKLRNSNSRLEKNVARHAADLRISNARLLDVFAKRVATQELLAKSEAEYRASFEAGTGKVQMEPLSGRLLRVNAACAATLGHEAKDLVGHPMWDFVHPDDRAATIGAFDKLLAGETAVCIAEARYVRRDGVSAWMRMSATVVLDPAVGLPRLALAEIENIDLRNGTQAALRASEILVRLALESGPSGVWAFDIRNGLFWTDHPASAMTAGAVPAETWLALTGPEYAAWIKRIHPDDRDRWQARLLSLFADGNEQQQTVYRTGGGGGGWSTLSQRCVIVERDLATGLPVRAVAAITDLTARTAALTEAQTAKANLEQILQQRGAVLAHRHLLLREVYHQMNDTLRLIDRLLAARTRQSGDQEALDTLSDQRSRIRALGFVHGELMTSVEVETFDAAVFLHELCAAILANGNDSGVVPRVDAEHLKLTLGQAIPFGLLVTELLNNCLRHGVSRQSGHIAVSLKRGKNAEMTLIVSDEGTGRVAAEPSGSFATGLETRLVRDLASQLGSDLRMSAEDGLKVEIAIFHRTQ